MKNLAQKVKEAIETGNYYFNAQYCHPERVESSALEHAENTAEEYLSNITDEEIKKYTNESVEENGEETNVSRILTDIADRNCDHSGYETITCVVIAKDEEQCHNNLKNKNIKFVTLLNENGNNNIINEFNKLKVAFESYKKLDVNDLLDDQEYELAKYDEDNIALDWEDEELKSINQPLGSWITKP